LKVTLVVAIHGNWCGPNWTAGRNIPANDPSVDWSVPAMDSLDLACKMHDKSCSGTGGCSAASDRRLAARAYLIGIINPRLAFVAQAVAVAMTASSLRRDF